MSVTALCVLLCGAVSGLPPVTACAMVSVTALCVLLCGAVSGLSPVTAST